MSTGRRKIRLETSAMMLLFMASFLLVAAAAKSVAGTKDSSPKASPLSNPRALIAQMVQNEIKAQNDDATHWRFCKTAVKQGVSKTWNVVETKDGEVERLTAINGHALDAKQQQAEQERIQKFLSSPDEQAKRRDSAAKDYQKEQQLMKMLPDAFLYTLAGKRGDLARFRFRPNPQFHPTSHEAEVFQHMTGVMVVNVRNKRLAEFRGHLTSGVKFGYGILGYLDKGGTFDVKQQNVRDSHWDVTLLETNITGKALLFKSIAIQEKIIESDYHRVSDNLTLQQAANLLKERGSRSASAAKAASLSQVTVASAIAERH